MSTDYVSPTAHAEGRSCELWVIQSESDLADGGLAYWGPFDDTYQAQRMADTCECATLVWTPKPEPREKVAMSDHATPVEILKEALFEVGALPGDPTFAALDALVALAEQADTADYEYIRRAKFAEERAAKLEAALAEMPDAVRKLTTAYHTIVTTTGRENILKALREGDAARDKLFAIEDSARAALGEGT